MVYCCLWADDNMGFGGGDQSLSLAITTYFFTVGHSHVFEKMQKVEFFKKSEKYLVTSKMEQNPSSCSIEI